MVKLYLQKLHLFPIISKKTNSRNKKSEDFKFDLMEIIFGNIINLGNIGDKVKVKDGYGRNFLLKGKALDLIENQELVNKKKMS